MHTYSEDETYVSLVRTMPALSGWSLPTLLAQYGELAVRHREAVQVDAPEFEAIEQDMAGIADEIERRVSTVPSNVADAVFALRDQVRGCAERLGAPELNRGADAMAAAVAEVPA